jgi:hypothetical protein
MGIGLWRATWQTSRQLPRAAHQRGQSGPVPRVRAAWALPEGPSGATAPCPQAREAGRYRPGDALGGGCRGGRGAQGQEGRGAWLAKRPGCQGSKASPSPQARPRGWGLGAARGRDRPGSEPARRPDTHAPSPPPPVAGRRGGADGGERAHRARGARARGLRLLARALPQEPGPHPAPPAPRAPPSRPLAPPPPPCRARFWISHSCCDSDGCLG